MKEEILTGTTQINVNESETLCFNLVKACNSYIGKMSKMLLQNCILFLNYHEVPRVLANQFFANLQETN